jgi:hypothetical protein
MLLLVHARHVTQKQLRCAMAQDNTPRLKSTSTLDETPHATKPSGCCYTRPSLQRQPTNRPCLLLDSPNHIKPRTGPSSSAATL